MLITISIYIMNNTVVNTKSAIYTIPIHHSDVKRQCYDLESYRMSDEVVAP